MLGGVCIMGMTEKRFISIEKWFNEDGNRRVHVVLDNGKFWNNFMTQYDADKTCRKLNELAEENKEIKIQYDNLKAQRDEFYHGARENANRVGQLEKENKELREQLKDCTEKAKEEIRKQAENEAIRWANIGR